jgi:hypothetical protein
LFLEDSHAQPCARGGAGNNCYPYSLEKGDAESKPFLYPVAVTVSASFVSGSTERHWAFSLCRIKIEEEYAKNLAKLSQNSLAAQEEG